MRMSKLLLPTLREVPAEAEIASHQLMLRAGLIRKLSAGVYSYLPVGLKVLKNIENIIRKGMDDAGAQELLMSALLPAESYMASGRWERFGPEMFRLKDRKNAQFCLGPTHEEIFTQTVIDTVRSYKEYPYTLYQIQTKYRDEVRPRFGVMRTREFVMKDAYSFDINQEGLDKSYEAMYHAYCNIFDTMGLNYMIVDADSGAMGGSGSQEYMVLSDVGEDTVVYCDACRYAANLEKATSRLNKNVEKEAPLAMEKAETPNAKTIEEVAAFFQKAATDFVKTLIYLADEKPVAVLVRGDRELNETKLKNVLGVNSLELAPASIVEDVTHATVGFAGPVGLEIDIICDEEVELMSNFIVGANETDYHYTNVNIGRDFTPAKIADIRTAVAGDICPVCGKPLATAQGIEVGHIFKLGTKYSDALGLTWGDGEDEKSIIMGCYGIGVNRCIAAIIEQNHDENGIIWPKSVTPYQVEIVAINAGDETQMAVAEQLMEALEKKGISVLLDDRDERPGVKFKDADLVGIPVRITVGKKAKDGAVEFKFRAESEFKDYTVEEALQAVIDFYA